MLTVIVFILILGLFIFVHELGHFVFAKRAGIKVEEFGFGFPPRIFGIKKGETIYSLNLLPLGGFVRIFGEDRPKKSKANDQRAFYNHSIKTRAKILIAGVAMNFLLAIVLLSFGYWLGLPAMIEDNETANLNDVKVQITQVAYDSPAEQAGIKMGDTIKELKINNQRLEINKIEDIQNFVGDYQGQEMIVVIQRGSEVLEKTLTPRIEHPEDEGPLGVALARTAIISYAWYSAIYRGIISTISLTWFIIIALFGIFWELFTRGQLTAEIAGPVGIFNLTGQATKLGFIYVLQLAALLNINLAIINSLPFPALDGGRLLFLIIEKIKGSPISHKVERIAHTAGFVILILLMIAVTWRDIMRVF